MAIQYLLSNKVHVFPCANRVGKIDLESKINTEYNLIHLPSLLSNNSSYTLSKDGNVIKFILKGYYFEIDLDETSILPLYVNCKTAESVLWTGDTEISGQNTLALCNYKDNSFNLDNLEDNTFYGLALNNQEFDTDSLQILDKEGNLVNNKPINIKLLGDIIDTKSVISNGYTFNFTQNEDTGNLNLAINKTRTSEADFANLDSEGFNINKTYIKDIKSNDGITATYYKGDNTTGTFSTSGYITKIVSTTGTGNAITDITADEYGNLNLTKSTEFLGPEYKTKVDNIETALDNVEYTKYKISRWNYKENDTQYPSAKLVKDTFDKFSGTANSDGTWNTITINGTTNTIPAIYNLPITSNTILGGIKLWSENKDVDKIDSMTGLPSGNYHEIKADTMGRPYVYLESGTDTRNTAGNTNNTSSKGYLVFTTDANSTTSAQTYKRTTLYIGSDNYLVAKGFNATSDKRLKENIEDFNTVQSILNLPIKRFDYIDGPKNQIGCLAQDLQELYPELVTEDEDGYLSIKESKLVYLLMDEVKKLKKEVEELKGGK